jgi:hypothetical protein
MSRSSSDFKDPEITKAGLDGGEPELHEHANFRPRKTLEQKQQELAAALEIDPGVDKWSWAAFYVRK